MKCFCYTVREGQLCCCCYTNTHGVCQIVAVESSLFPPVFWQLVPVTHWAPCLEETAVNHTQEVASASASSQDTTAICVWCETKLNCQIQILHLCTRVNKCFHFVSTAATALGSVQ